MDREPGRVLMVKAGYNPNSSSVGTNLAPFLAAGTILVFGGLLVFDTWRITRSGQFGQDDYVFAAVQIYLDLLNMFLFILSLLGNRSRR